MDRAPAEGTTPVREAHRFDTARLAEFIRREVCGFSGPLQVAQFTRGQSNPTYLIQADQTRYVLRRKPPGTLLPSAHAVDREHRVITALAKSEVPVPETHALCEDESVIGTAFYLMAYVEGRILWDPALPGMQPPERRAIFEEMNRAIAALHRVDYPALGLADYGKPGNYFGRQIERWTKQYRAAETERIEAMDNLIAWLPAHLPAGDETSLAHGDYRIDNLIFHPTEPRILAVLDWELSTLGHPMADLAYHCMPWRFAPGRFRGLAGLDLQALGIPDEADHVSAYCLRVGRDRVSPEAWEYFMAFGMFRLVAILQGIAARAQQGNASNQDAIETGRQARPLAEQAWRQVERLTVRGSEGHFLNR